MDGYLKELRTAVGTMPVILNFATIGVRNEKGELLLQARDRACTKWGFPGGALNYGESYTEGAIREFREETGFDAVIDDCIGIFDKYFASYPNGDAQTIVVAYKGHVISGDKTIDNKETYDLHWFADDEMPTLFNDQHQAIYDAMLQKGL